MQSRRLAFARLFLACDQRVLTSQARQRFWTQGCLLGSTSPSANRSCLWQTRLSNYFLPSAPFTSYSRNKGEKMPAACTWSTFPSIDVHMFYASIQERRAYLDPLAKEIMSRARGLQTLPVQTRAHHPALALCPPEQISYRVASLARAKGTSCQKHGRNGHNVQ